MSKKCWPRGAAVSVQQKPRCICKRALLARFAHLVAFRDNAALLPAVIDAKETVATFGAVDRSLISLEDPLHVEDQGLTGRARLLTCRQEATGRREDTVKESHHTTPSRRRTTRRFWCVSCWLSPPVFLLSDFACLIYPCHAQPLWILSHSRCRKRTHILHASFCHIMCWRLLSQFWCELERRSQLPKERSSRRRWQRKWQARHHRVLPRFTCDSSWIGPRDGQGPRAERRSIR